MGEFVTTLAGAAHRQKEIAKAIDWMTSGPVDVYLEHEPENPHDSNAVRVDVERQPADGKRIKIGYLPAHIAISLQPDIDKIRVKGVDVRAPDDAYHFWNLAFTLDDGKLSISLSGDGPPTAPAVEPGSNKLSAATTQSTLKKLKAHKVGATVAFISGVILMVIAVVEPDAAISGVAVFAPPLMIYGIIWYFITNIRGWWHHRKSRK